MVGSAALLSGTTRLTVTVVAIVIEATDGTAYLILFQPVTVLNSLLQTEFVHILPLILACLIAKWVGDLFSTPLIEVIGTELRKVSYSCPLSPSGNDRGARRTIPRMVATPRIQ